MVKQSYCTGETGVSIVSESTTGAQLKYLMHRGILGVVTSCLYSPHNPQSNSDCVPFEEGLTEQQQQQEEEEEPPKSLLEVSDTDRILREQSYYFYCPWKYTYCANVFNPQMHREKVLKEKKKKKKNKKNKKHGSDSDSDSEEKKKEKLKKVK